MLRILFAHPDQKLSEMYVSHMGKHFLVDSVSDGLAATRKFKLSPPDAVVSDYHLPMVSGLALLKFVRSQPVQNFMPFIFLTNFHDNTQALNFAANDWLEPANCHPDYLLDRIYHHLKTHKYGIQIH